MSKSIRSHISTCDTLVSLIRHGSLKPWGNAQSKRDYMLGKLGYLLDFLTELERYREPVAEAIRAAKKREAAK